MLIFWIFYSYVRWGYQIALFCKTATFTCSKILHMYVHTSRVQILFTFLLELMMVMWAASIAVEPLYIVIASPRLRAFLSSPYTYIHCDCPASKPCCRARYIPLSLAVERSCERPCLRVLLSGLYTYILTTPASKRPN